MKAFSFLSQAAVPHPDNTITFVRSPINRFGPFNGVQPNVVAMLAVMIRFDPVESGTHNVRFVGVDDDGRPIGLEHESRIEFIGEARGHHDAVAVLVLRAGPEPARRGQVERHSTREHRQRPHAHLEQRSGSTQKHAPGQGLSSVHPQPRHRGPSALARSSDSS